MTIPVKTIKKKDLLALLANFSDDANIYVHTEVVHAQTAISAASRGNHTELFFGLENDVQRESDGVCLIAYLPK
jgi:hypothetical protein